MNKKDYFKYYIQGSDNYLIPKYEFKEILRKIKKQKMKMVKIYTIQKNQLN